MTPNEQFPPSVTNCSESINSPVQLFSVQFHTPPMHTLKKTPYSRLTVHWQMLSSDHMSTLTKRYILVEAHVLVHMMCHGTRMDTEKQQYMFHFVG